MASPGWLYVLGAAGALLGAAGCQTNQGAVLRSIRHDAAPNTEPYQDAGLDTTPADASGIWQPTQGMSWQIQLNGSVDTTLNVDLFDLDLSEGDAIRTLSGLGRVVVCDFSAGSYEDWRNDAAQFPAADLGNPLADYPTERWLDVRDPILLGLMAARMDQAAALGCRGVHPENLDAVLNDSGFPLTRQDQLDYDLSLASLAHARGLSVGFTGGDSELAQGVEPAFDWALSYGCVSAGDCSEVLPFTAAGKVVFLVEPGDASSVPTICPLASSLALNAIIKNPSLDAFRVPCP